MNPPQLVVLVETCAQQIKALIEGTDTPTAIEEMWKRLDTQ